MLQGTTLSNLVDPEVGIVFGYGWATDARTFLKDHPTALLVRDEGDIQEWALGGDVTFCGLPVSMQFTFGLDELITVALDFEVEAFDAAHIEALVQAVSRWFSEDLESPEEGVLQAEEEGTRMIFDLLDKRLVLEDAEL